MGGIFPPLKQLKTNTMKPELKIYYQPKTEYNQCEYIDYEYMRHCIYTNNQEL